jgi:fluoride exporter
MAMGFAENRPGPSGADDPYQAAPRLAGARDSPGRGIGPRPGLRYFLGFLAGLFMQTFWHIVFVAVGSAIGGVTRWGFSTACARCLGATAFPVGTFIINISGSLFLGWLLTHLRQQLSTNEANINSIEHLHMLIAVGFTGSYTTFSTFEFETHALLDGGRIWTCASYVALSVFLGLLAVRLGVWFAER